MTITKQEVERLVSKGLAHMTTPPKMIPDNKVVDAPLLGNGDLGAAISGGGAKLIYHFGKNDFMTQAHLGETPEQRKKRLLNTNTRRTGSHLKTVGWLELRTPELDGCSYDAWQDPLLGEVRMAFAAGKAALRTTSLICAEQNTLILRLENSGAIPLSIEFSTMPGIYGNGEIFGYDDGVREDSVWFDYPAQICAAEGRRWVWACVSADKPDTVYMPEKLSRKGGRFSLFPGETAHLCMTILSDLDAKEPAREVFSVNHEAKRNIDALIEAHRAWWMALWQRSLVSTGNETLDAFYYGSLYILASSTREGKVPPGLFGPWITTDTPSWTGLYTLNYNYQSPFFPLYTGNMVELANSYIEPLLDIIPVGQLYARELSGHRGILLPVEIGPFGMACSTIFHHQKSNAAYCCCNIFMHYFMTRDQDFGRKAYPFVRETVDYWEDDLVFEDGRYNLIGDSMHEVYYREGGEKNNTHGLGLVKMIFRDILTMSKELGLDADRREKWQYIYDHLPDFPTYEREGVTVFRANEDNYPWSGGNGTSIKHIYPFNCIGRESTPELLEIARNTVRQKRHLFDNHNAFCEYTVMCARVGDEPQLLYDQLIGQCELRGLPNRYILHGGGGIENCSGVTSGMHEMMLQSFEDVLRLFPVWPENTDAYFKNLRAYGAFLVSSSITDNVIGETEILSEKGMPLCVVLPWERCEILVNGGSLGLFDTERVRIDTKSGDTILLRRA